MIEEWRAVRGYEGRYEVSNTGHVKSLRRSALIKAGRYRTVRERILRPCHKRAKLGNQTYRTVCLSDGVSLTVYKVAYLAATAFLGAKSGDQVCRHLDGNGENDNVTNLKWGTLAENTEDTYTHGTMIYANKVANRVIDAVTAYEIYKMRGGSQKVVGELFGVGRGVVHHIWTGRNWRRAIAELQQVESVTGTNLVSAAKTTRPPAKSKADTYLEQDLS